MTGLLQRSVDVILEHQSSTGAYPASPSFETYRYCWFRDGSFIAYAMDLVGETQSAARFHAWAAGVIDRRRELVLRAVRKSENREPLGPTDYLHTRYSLNGREGRDTDWPNFQLDGFGTWLWALNQHQRQTGRPLPADWLDAASMVAQYLQAFWSHPCYDCWEEFPDQVHTYTLAAIYSGLQAYASLSGANLHPLTDEIRHFLLANAVQDGRLVKFPGSSETDANLVALVVPYAVLPWEEPCVAQTVREIESSLRSDGGGVHRYRGDTYYGGGEWVLLTAWLGWYYAHVGEREKAAEALAWVEAQADALGNLPEQVSTTLNAPDRYGEWARRWGEIARPLLWSHAKHIILSHHLK